MNVIQFIKYIKNNRYLRINDSTVLDRYKLRFLKFKFIGKNVRIERNCEFYNTENLILEDNIFLGRELYIDSVVDVIIKSGTMIGPRVTIISSNHNYNSLSLKSLPYDDVIIDRQVIIGENVWIGASVNILPGSVINEGAVCSMGSTVRGEIPKLAIVSGNPCSVIGYRNDEIYYKLKSEGKIYNKIYAKKKKAKQI